MNYAADSTKRGSAMARAVVQQVYGTSMYLPRLVPPDPSSRLMAGATTTDPKTTTTSLKIKGTLTAGLQVYPNPTNTSFAILYSDEGSSTLQYTIADLLGKEIRKGPLERGAATEFQAQGFNAGLYIITISNNQNLLAQKKLVIMK